MSDQRDQAGLTRHYNPSEDKPHPMTRELEPIQTQFAELWGKFKNSRQRIYKFENGYGASAIQGPFSWYGETHPKAWEVCPLDFRTDPNGELISDDIQIVDTEEELQQLLDQIAGR